MLTALVLASLTQFSVIVEQSETVVYEMPAVQTVTYQQYSYRPVVSAVPTVAYSLPVASFSVVSPTTYFMRADPLVSVYSLPMGGRTVIRERWPGFRSRTILRY